MIMWCNYFQYNSLTYRYYQLMLFYCCCFHVMAHDFFHHCLKTASVWFYYERRTFPFGITVCTANIPRDSTLKSKCSSAACRLLDLSLPVMLTAFTYSGTGRMMEWCVLLHVSNEWVISCQIPTMQVWKKAGECHVTDDIQCKRENGWCGHYIRGSSEKKTAFHAKIWSS